MYRTLRGRLSLAFMLLAVGGVALVGLLVNVTFERHFERYLREGLQERAERIAGALGRTHAPREGWSDNLLMEITHWSLMEGVRVRVESADGALIWQSPGAETEIITPDKGKHLYGARSGSVPQLAAPIMSDGRTVGWLRVAPGPQGLYSEHDLHFRTGLNQVLLLATMAAGLIAILAALVVARGLHAPLETVTRVAEKLRTGDWQHRVPPFALEELQKLGDSLNHLAESLQQHESMRKRLTRDVAHELRTPLSLVRSHLEAFADGVWEATPDRLRLCHQEVMRLVRLVDDLNRLAEAESAALHLHYEDVPLREFIRTLAQGFEPLFQQKGIRFVVALPEGNPVLRLDRDKASRVVMNLLANAEKYTLTGGTVTLSARVSARDVQIQVADTGPGIPAEDLPRIFERFYRGDPARSRATGGAGLGLAIARVLAEAHHGRIEVSSPPGQGATFSFILPRPV